MRLSSGRDVKTPRGLGLLLGCALSSACPQERISLGRPAEDAKIDSGPEAGPSAPPDSGELTDRAAPPEDGGPLPTPTPLSLRLEVEGRENVTRLEASCSAHCIPVRVLVEGGEPPYHVRWDDGEEGSERVLCADPLRPRSVSVVDSSGGLNMPASLGLEAISFQDCPRHLGSEQDERWNICRSVAPRPMDCGEGRGTRAIDLGLTVQAASFSASFFATGYDPLQIIEVHSSAAPCGEDSIYASFRFKAQGPHSSDHGVLELSATSSSRPVRYLKFFAYMSQDLLIAGMPILKEPADFPEDFAVYAARVCESVVFAPTDGL